MTDHSKLEEMEFIKELIVFGILVITFPLWLIPYVIYTHYDDKKC